MNQPFLHDLVCTLKAPLQWWSRPDGETTATGVQGIYCGDDRVVSSVVVRVRSHEVAPIGHAVTGSASRFTTVLRTPAEGADPVLTLTRLRSVTGSAVVERLIVESAAGASQEVELTVTLDLDATPMEAVKSGAGPVAPAGLPGEGLPSHRSDDAMPGVTSGVGPAETAAGVEWRWRDDATVARFMATAPARTEGARIVVPWTVAVGPDERAELSWRLDLSDGEAKFVEADLDIAVPDVPPGALRRLLEASAADLRGLTLAEAGDPSRHFLAAGAPWFFTLFGRDSLIAATMIAEAAPGLSLGTLRTLAARQGRAVDVDTAEQPGKILHEVRRVALDLHDGGTVLPPEYYGTIDATPLWLMLAGRLLEQGRESDVAGLLDHVVAALGWLRDHSDPDGDGFLEYFDESGHGLANQGWKDSGDSIRFADGTIAEGPIVLVEVQGYAAAAARAGAAILARLGRTDAERASAADWERYAVDMADRIRAKFWVSDDAGPYLAIALDRDKRPVTGVASNMGHLLGLGVLSHDEERVVVERLTSPSMASGFGVRTMSMTNGAYWPMRYHVGSVWTHDTAWIVAGMDRAGFHDEAAQLAGQLLRAAEGFDFRLPELFGGWSVDEAPSPMPYPASCRPQAWAAASAFVVAGVLAG